MNLQTLRFEMSYESRKLKERFWMKLAWMLPRTLAMWAVVRIGAHATTGKYGNTIVPELTFMDALKRWDEKPHTCSFENCADSHND